MRLHPVCAYIRNADRELACLKSEWQSKEMSLLETKKKLRENELALSKRVRELQDNELELYKGMRQLERAMALKVC